MEMVFPYVTKTQSNTFDASYKNAFKQIKDIRDFRLAYIDELSGQEMAVALFKDLVSGRKCKLEEMYKTTLEFEIHFKFIILSNLMPTFKVDGGMKRRGIVFEFINLFTDDKRKVNNVTIFEKDEVLDLF
jgi:phage/plasmid-associated DNA primase